MNAAGRPLIPPSKQKPVDDAGQDGDVPAGDGDDVVGARGLQPQPDVIRQSGPIADQDGGDNRRRDGIVWRHPSLNAAADVRADDRRSLLHASPALANINQPCTLD